MQCLPLAPLAQLAEQLTLNQQMPAENPEGFADSHQRAALGAAADVNASATCVDPPLNSAAARIAQAWPFLPPHVQESINLLVDAALCGRLSKRGQS